MKKSIAIFSSHDEAREGLEALMNAGMEMKNFSIIGKAEIVDDQIKVKSNRALIAAPTVAGTVIGTTIGLLTGIGLFAIPGLGVLFGAGAIVGAFAGFDAGIIAGGVSSILVELGIKENHIQYEEHLQEGKFLMILDGSKTEIEKAENILEGLHLGITEH
jgi:uncharacterized membrane protein